jgi:transposase
MKPLEIEQKRGKMKELRKYSAELKAEVVKMANEQGLSQSQIAEKLNIPKGTIGLWISMSRARKTAAKPGDQSIGDLVAENKRLMKALEEARMEREILKKAAAYFAKDSIAGTRS